MSLAIWALHSMANRVDDAQVLQDPDRLEQGSSLAEGDAGDARNEAELADDAPTWTSLLSSASDNVVRFLSTASNETLGVCAMGLGATTYIVLGRVGLVLMGVLGGVVLHATWEAKHTGEMAEMDGSRKREAGLEVARRVLEWRETKLETAGRSEKETSRTRHKPGMSTFPPGVAESLKELCDSVVRDYVR